MVQREVGERLAASPGDKQFGAVSLRVAYRARASVVRRVAATVFGRRPTSSRCWCAWTVSTTRGVAANERGLFALIDEAFAQRRKTMRNALVRWGFRRTRRRRPSNDAAWIRAFAPEELSLEAFASVADAVASGRAEPAR